LPPGFDALIIILEEVTIMKFVAVGFLVLCAVGAAFAALGDVVASWPTPGGQCVALGVSNSYIYALSHTQSRVYIMNINNGSIVGSLPAAGAGNTRGLAYVSGNYLWQGRSYSAPLVFYQTHATTGSIYRSIPSPSVNDRGLAPLCTGDGGVGTTALLSTTWTSPWRLSHVNMTTGSVIASYPTPAGVYDPAYDWRNRLVWGAWSSTTVVGFTTTGSLVATFGANESIFGAAYTGEYLYITQNRIWKVHCPQFVGVAPSSFGKVKAVFK
jgi:hypothetical protein